MDNFEKSWTVFTWSWKNKREIGRKLAKLYRWFRGSRNVDSGILVLGLGGTGKTTLARLLAGDYAPLLDSVGRYDEDLFTEEYELKDAPCVNIVVPPGQAHRRQATWTNLLKDVSAGKFRGIFLVGAYGYHSLGEISYKDHKLYKGNKSPFLKAYLNDRRKAELAVLRDLEPHLRRNGKKLWIVSLIAKQDLWWAARSAAESWYTQGEYAKLLRRILKKEDPLKLRHELIFASLTVSNFKTGRGELLKPTAAGYDYQRQIKSLRRVFESVDALREWESN